MSTANRFDADVLIAQVQAIIAAINAASVPKVTFEPTEIATLPNRCELEQNYPNPFNPVTTIQFAVPSESHVRVKVYNSFGAEVATLIDQQVSSGTYKVNWDANWPASGFYFCREVQKCRYGVIWKSHHGWQGGGETLIIPNIGLEEGTLIANLCTREWLKDSIETVDISIKKNERNQVEITASWQL